MKIILAIILSLGLVACQASRHFACGTKQSTLCLKIEKSHQTVSLNQDDINSIDIVCNTNGIKMLHVVLTPKGSKKLNTVLNKNIGNQLITYWNDSFVSQAVIQSTAGKNLLITLPSADTQRLTRKMTDVIHRLN